MRLTEYGRREWLGGAAAMSAVFAAGVATSLLYEPLLGILICILSVAVWFGVAAFFRDPNRNVPAGDDTLVSPADGVVRDIELIRDTEENGYFENKGVVRIGIFLSVLDVHLNRVPCDLAVEKKIYRKGFYHDARSPDASKENEAMTVVCRSAVPGMEFPLLIRQISGAIAKRIVCPVEPGMKFAKGQRYGMIKFGSRTELYLPARPEIEVAVKVGDRVHGGLTVVARIKDGGDQR